MPGLSPLNKALARITKRAELGDNEKLRETFVDSGVAAVLESQDHQVLFGRRGTGKTHAFRYLQSVATGSGDVGIYVDLRTVGSVEGLFGESSITASERTARLLVDVLNTVHDSILAHALDDDGLYADESFVNALDALLESLSAVVVDGTVEVATEAEEAAAVSRSGGVRATASHRPSIGLEAHDSTVASRSASAARVSRGTERIGLNFTDVARALRNLGESLQGQRIWLLLDEWSSLPRELQPYLGAFLVKCVLPVTGFTVKIAAIEQHTNFRQMSTGGDMIGLELGADISANISLDDFMVFEQEQDNARAFFAGLFSKHLAFDDDGQHGVSSPEGLLRLGFTDARAFDELVRAAEGVPRDAINIASRAAVGAGDGRISVPRVRAAAKAWYQADKEAALQANPEARRLLDWVVDKVIREKRARSFLVSQDASRRNLLMTLFDARLVHLTRRGYSGQDDPGKRYDVFSIDYGTYVDLINTKFAPQGSLPGADEGMYVDVPTEDLRAIRRAILDMDAFEAAAP